MGKINWGRVIAGGLLAGLVLNVFDWLVNGVWLMNDWAQAMQARNLPAMGGSMIMWFVVTDFIAGIWMVWLYAAIRPRYGAGPMTAAKAGFAGWFVAVFLHALGESPVGLIPLNLYLKPGIAALIFVPLAAVVGAWAYKEEVA